MIILILVMTDNSGYDLCCRPPPDCFYNSNIYPARQIIESHEVISKKEGSISSSGVAGAVQNNYEIDGPVFSRYLILSRKSRRCGECRGRSYNLPVWKMAVAYGSLTLSMVPATCTDLIRSGIPINSQRAKVLQSLFECRAPMGWTWKPGK